ncbi:MULTISPECIES: hypothetical protein [Arthrobacter]|uniref:Uncharacterized protein n=1 Tax=Arthrobacter terricola TaxID=2547396 RepID=A0A4R5KMD8_9MICC|nr:MULTISPECIES: hypothetical protein [Arthrobacter]MBT8161523.1 hypothetical protein [Arthrobacter sp. GN70]TDF95690.1 hypothetical protein E1809_11760 [Arthrobacter terricola]
MDWLIWAIVIVLIVAIAWWLLSRNNAKTSQAGTTTPPSPSPTAASPQMDSTTAALTGSAPLLGTAVPSEQALDETRPAQKAADAEPQVEPQAEPKGTQQDGFDVDDWEGPDGAAESRTVAPTEEPLAGMVGEEPVIEEPQLDEPVLSESVPEPATSSAPELEPEGLEGGVTADDVTAADSGPSGSTMNGAAPAGTASATDTASSANAAQQADSAEWEATWSEGSAPAAPVHHREYTEPHAPTLPGAETAAAETDEPATEGGQAASLGGHLAADKPYGEGSAAAGADGSGPEGYTVKGNVDTMIYHDEDSPAYHEIQAGVWFISSAHAEAAGFRPPRRSRR